MNFKWSRNTKKYTAYFTNTEKKIRATFKFHFTPVRMTNIKKKK